METRAQETKRLTIAQTLKETGSPVLKPGTADLPLHTSPSTRQVIDREEAERQRQHELEKMKMEAEREQKQYEREREQRQLEYEQEREQRQLEHERERERRQLEREHELRMGELRSQGRREQDRPQHNSFEWRCESFPVFDEKKDDIDRYLENFERRALLSNADRDKWVPWLNQVLCSGKAAEVYNRCMKTPDVTYEEIKAALLSYFNLGPEEYRRRFRNLRPSEGEMPRQFSRRLETNLNRWLDSEEVDDFVGLRKLILTEQMMKCYGNDERLHVRQNTAAGWEETVALLDACVSARAYSRKERVSGSSRQQHRDRDREPEKNLNRVTVDSQKSQSGVTKVTCYRCNQEGHIARRCPGKAAGAAIPGTAWHRHQNVIHAVLGEKSLERMPVVEGTVNGQTCQVLRDTGCGCIIVQRDLVHPSKLLATTSTLVTINGAALTCPTARVYVESPYLTGMVGAVVMDSPLFPCIIGNVDGAVKAEFPQRRKSPESTLGDTGQEILPYRGEHGDHQDDTKSSRPITRIEAIKKEDVEGASTLLSQHLPRSDGVVEITPNLDTGSQPGVTAPSDLSIDPPTSRGGNVCSQMSPDEKGCTDILVSEPAAAVTRSQTAVENLRPRQRPLKTSGISEIGVNRASLGKAQKEDPSLQKIFEHAESGTVLDHKHGQSKFFVTKGLLMRSYEEYTAPGRDVRQIVVPRRLRHDVMKLGHEGLLSGHLATDKTYDRIISHFYWPALRADIRRFCQSCDSCQRSVPRGRVRKVPLGYVPIINEPFSRVGVDIVGPLPRTSSGKKYILTLVDYATRYPEGVAISDITTATVAEALISIFSRCGFPRVIHSDRGTQFTSEMMEEVCRLIGIKQSFTPAYHPQANGLTERLNGTLKEMLKRMTAERPKEWDRFLDPLLFAYREVPNSSTQFSPFELLYGRAVRGPMALLRETWEEESTPEETKTSYEYVFDLRNRLERVCKVARDNLEVSKLRYKKYFDKKASDRCFKEGDQVLLMLPSDHSKLSMQWKGPFTIVEKIGYRDYRVNVNGQERVYHANMLKHYLARPTPEKSRDACHPHRRKGVSSTSVVAAAVIHEAESDDIPTVCIHPDKKEPDIYPDLSENQKDDLEAFITEFCDRLDSKPGTTDLEEHDLELTSDVPVRCRPYHTPYAVRQIVDQEIESMLDMGVIEPSKSPYASPVVLVSKKDGTYRFCVDYRRLNSITKFHAEPLPDQSYLFTKLQDAKYLSKIDLTKGYWQVPLAEQDRPKTAFITHSGLWQWRVMPFGLVNSGATFSKLMKKLLVGIDNVYHFMDDMVIATQTWEHHLETLKTLFSRLRQHDLTAKPEKCQFGYPCLEFLGHMVGKGTLRTEPNKVRKMTETTKPTNKKELRSFLGLVGYYQRFIPHYATIAAPLTDALKKGEPSQFIWTEERENAYQRLKDSIWRSPILHIADVHRTFVLRTDASDKGIGCVLLQDHDGMLFPVEFASRKLKDAEKRYAVVERECLALVWAIQKFQPYLYGKDFLVQTDHSPLTFLHTAKLENARLMRWAILLQQYRFRVEAIKGSCNFGADYLSRCPNIDSCKHDL